MSVAPNTGAADGERPRSKPPATVWLYGGWTGQPTLGSSGSSLADPDGEAELARAPEAPAKPDPSALEMVRDWFKAAGSDWDRSQELIERRLAEANANMDRMMAEDAEIDMPKLPREPEPSVAMAKFTGPFTADDLRMREEMEVYEKQKIASGEWVMEKEPKMAVSVETLAEMYRKAGEAGLAGATWCASENNGIIVVSHRTGETWEDWKRRALAAGMSPTVADEIIMREMQAAEDRRADEETEVGTYATKPQAAVGNITTDMQAAEDRRGQAAGLKSSTPYRCGWGTPWTSATLEIKPSPAPRIGVGLQQSDGSAKWVDARPLLEAANERIRMLEFQLTDALESAERGLAALEHCRTCHQS